MNQTEGRASGEVPESQPSGPDLAERIAEICGESLFLARGIPVVVSSVVFAPLIRESLAPIRKALEGAEWEVEGCLCVQGEKPGHGEWCAIGKALRLLRGEELSGNRGVGGGE